MVTIVWFRQDLRTADQPALAAAAERGTVLPVFILDDSGSGPHAQLGAASRWWLHHSLTALKASLGGLVVARGDPRIVLPALTKGADATAVFWNRCYEPHAIARDSVIKAALKADGIDAQSFAGNVLNEPWDIKTGGGDPYKVFTPYWRACLARPVKSLPTPIDIKIAGVKKLGVSIAALDLLPTQPNWAVGWNELWQPGEAGAITRLEAFLGDGLNGYGVLRDCPARPNVSRLSPHLHWGEIAPQHIVERVRAVGSAKPAQQADGNKFLSEIGWREFAHHLLFHFPSLPDANWKPAFNAYPWDDNPKMLRAWQRGQTGYPIVDAGMRQLWQTGWMHNRVRMVVASFLIKHLRIDWRQGQAWFWDTLVDADLAANAASWQWVAGSGADAAPYFRIFNPMTQGERFDPEGVYVKRWCPELAKLPTEHIHAPFKASPSILAAAGVRLGETYPLPIVDHATARQAALDGYRAVKPAAAAL